MLRQSFNTVEKLAPRSSHPWTLRSGNRFFHPIYTSEHIQETSKKHKTLYTLTWICRPFQKDVVCLLLFHMISLLPLNLTITFQKASDPLEKKTNLWNWAPQTGSLETRGDCKLNWPAWFGKQWRSVVTRTQWFLEKMALCKDAKHKQSSAIWIDLFYCKMTEACKDNKYSVKSPVGQTQFTPSTMIFGGKSPQRTNSKW